MSLCMSIENEPTPCGCGETRREFLARAGGGLGLLALGSLLQSESRESQVCATEGTTANPSLRSQQPHFPPKAKAVIWLFMEGGPSGVDLFDRKPELERNDGKRIEIETFNGNP